MARKLIVEIAGDPRGLLHAYRQSSRASNDFGRSLSRSARGATVATVGFRGLGRSIAFASGAFLGGAGLTAGLKASVSGFSSFTEAMQQAVGLAGVAQDQIGAFSKQVLALAPVVGKSPQELAKAFYFVASSGIAAADAMDVVTAAAKASAAGLGETQVVADAVTSAMNAYGPSVLSAQQATDVLVATVREGKGEADQFAGSIGNVTAFASQLGVSFDEVGASLAAMTRLGTDAQTAAVQLQAVFSGLVKVTPQASKAFKSVGLNVDDLLKTLAQPQGLLKFLTKVKGAFGDNTKALAQAFPNIRAVRGLFALVGKQADEVRGIFERTAKNTGSLATAFGAVSDTTAQKFRQLRAAAQVAGISIGAIFAPLAGRIADALADAAASVTEFFDKLGKARTVRAKLNVIWEGVRDATIGAENALKQAVAAIDFKAIFAEARGIADGFQAQLEQTDFGEFGRRIGEGISKAAKIALPAAKDIAERLTNAVTAIDFEKLGRKMGPGLAAAVATAFSTLLDPSFWLRNWDLALAIGLTVFGGAIGRLAGRAATVLATRFGVEFAGLGGRLSASFVRAANEAGLALVGAVGRISERAATALLVALARLGPAVARVFDSLIGFVARPLARLVGVVAAKFSALSGISQFVVKVLGITAAIHLVTDFARKVIDTFRRLGRFIGDVFTDPFKKIKAAALSLALTIAKAFDFRVFGHSIIPGVHGIVVGLQHQIDELNRKKVVISVTETGADGVQRKIDSIKGKTVDVVIRTTPIHGSEGRASGVAPPKTTPTPAPKPAPAVPVPTPIVPTVDTNAAKKAADRVKQAFERAFGKLEIKLDIAQQSKSLRDDLAVLREMEKVVRARLAVTKNDLELQRQLVDIEGQQPDLQRQIAENQRKAQQGRQFKLLGLTAEGEPRVPGVSALLKRTKTLKQQVKGTFLDTAKTRGEFAGIAKVLAEGPKKVGRDVRQAILEMLNTISQALQGGTTGSVQTKFVKRGVDKMLEGLGLSPEQIKEIRQRFAQRGPGGTVPGRGIGAFGFALQPTTATTTRTGAAAGEPFVFHIFIDGEEVEARVTRRQQKKRGRQAPSRRGVNPGLHR